MLGVEVRDREQVMAVRGDPQARGLGLGDGACLEPAADDGQPVP